ncbi:insecticidal delta-endotoxin Cry8Ea1 family protein [Bacillus thuringiensis]
MKYKDRKHAKRKYKQALLATVATMTLGVSTLGSTASAFAEEKDKNATQQQNTVQQKDAGTYYEGEQKELNPLAQFDKWTQDLGKTTKAGDYKTTLGMAEKLLPTVYKDLNSGNFKNTLRSVTMLSTALIPYGGAFISPIIGLLWSENTVDKTQQMMDKINTLMDGAIKNYDLTALKQDALTLQKELKTFQDSVNGTISPSGTYYDSIQNGNVTQAKIINSLFNRLIDQSQKPGHELDELPLFVNIATAQLTFFKYMEQNAVQNDRIKMDSENFNNYFANHLQNDQTTYLTTKQLGEKYVKYVNDTYNKAETDFHKKTGGTLKTNADINFHQGLVDLKNLTAGNEAFLYVATGQKPTESNPSTPSVDGYYLDNNMKVINGETYYISPYDGFKNWNGIEFKKGENVTGWMKIRGKDFYYFSPADGAKNDSGKTFKKGEMMTGWVAVAHDGKSTSTDPQTSGGAWYYFDNKEDNKNFKGFTGRMLHNEKATVKNKEGKFIEHYFNENGTLGDN